MKVPTSTISRALTRLEKSLDILLVQRSSRGLVMTDLGKEYLQTCRRAMRTLRDGSNLVASRRERPSGLLKVACPITMARSVLAPLLKGFLERYPDLCIEIEPYTSGWDQEPHEDVDIFFKVRTPKDSLRHVRLYPGTRRGLFASADYIETHGRPMTPDELTAHTCIGSGPWKLTRGTKTTVPNVEPRVITSDPAVHLELVLKGFGIAQLPLYMATGPATRKLLVPILPRWSPMTITLCALFSGPARMTPKVRVLLDFLSEYIGTDQDPRLDHVPAKGHFTTRDASPIFAL